MHAAGTVADDNSVMTLGGDGVLQGFGDMVCAEGDSGGIAGNVDADAHWPASARAAFTAARSARPMSSSSSMAAGAQEQRPRQ